MKVAQNLLLVFSLFAPLLTGTLANIFAQRARRKQSIVTLLKPADTEELPLGTPVEFEASIDADQNAVRSVILDVFQQQVDGTWTRVARSVRRNVTTKIVTFTLSTLDATTPRNYQYRVRTRMQDGLRLRSPLSYFSTVASSNLSSSPTGVPSHVPSQTPSQVPSNVPTKTPSLVPSRVPSELPTQIPSTIPTNVPSSSPVEELPCDQIVDFCGANIYPTTCGSGRVIKLSQDLNCPYGGPTLVGVELDCQGYSIVGANGSSTGVTLFRDDGALRNCNIDGFWDNIVLYSGRNLLVENVMIGSWYNGIWVGTRVVDSVIRNVQINTQGQGLFTDLGADTESLHYENIHACGNTGESRGQITFSDSRLGNDRDPTYEKIRELVSFGPSITCLNSDPIQPNDPCSPDLFRFPPLPCIGTFFPTRSPVATNAPTRSAMPTATFAPTTDTCEGSWQEIETADLNGVTFTEFLGYSLDMSEDGSVIATGSPIYSTEYGRVQVWMWDLTTETWVPKGNSILGTQSWARFGNSLDLSGDGNILAVGEPYYRIDGLLNVGRVWVYEYKADSNTWVPMAGASPLEPDTIVEHQQMGHKVKLSSNGRTLAVGAVASGYATPAFVRTYDWDVGTSSWSKTGVDAIEEINFDDVGRSVDLGAAGNRLVTGAPASASHTGAVRVYDRDASHPTGWRLIGSDPAGTLFPPIAEATRYGDSVSLSSDGNVVAVGSEPGAAFVYRWDGSTFQLEASITDKEGQFSGFGNVVRLSGEGETLFVGEPYYNGDGDDMGRVHVYDYDGAGGWIQNSAIIVGDQNKDKLGREIAVNYNGRFTVAASSYPYGGSSPGRVQSFGCQVEE